MYGQHNTDIRVLTDWISLSKAKTHLEKYLHQHGNWDTVRVEVMKIALDCKYDQPNFKTLLLNTKGIVLIEGNHWHDNFWGDCHCPKCEHIKGENMLGKLTMAKREALLSK